MGANDNHISKESNICDVVFLYFKKQVQKFEYLFSPWGKPLTKMQVLLQNRLAMKLAPIICCTGSESKPEKNFDLKIDGRIFESNLATKMLSEPCVNEVDYKSVFELNVPIEKYHTSVRYF